MAMRQKSTATVVKNFRANMMAKVPTTKMAKRSHIMMVGTLPGEPWEKSATVANRSQTRTMMTLKKSNRTVVNMPKIKSNGIFLNNDGEDQND